MSQDCFIGINYSVLIGDKYYRSICDLFRPKTETRSLSNLDLLIHRRPLPARGCPASRRWWGRCAPRRSPAGSPLPRKTACGPTAATAACSEAGESYTGVKFFVGPKVQCVFCFEICTPDAREGEKGGSANFKTMSTEPLTQEIPRPLYTVQYDSAVREARWLIT